MVSSAQLAPWLSWCSLACSGCRPRRDPPELDFSRLDCTSSLRCRAKSRESSTRDANLHLRLGLRGKQCLRGTHSGGIRRAQTCTSGACWGSPLWTPNSSCTRRLPRETNNQSKAKGVSYVIDKEGGWCTYIFFAWDFGFPFEEVRGFAIGAHHRLCCKSERVLSAPVLKAIKMVKISLASY